MDSSIFVQQISKYSLRQELLLYFDTACTGFVQRVNHCNTRQKDLIHTCIVGSLNAVSFPSILNEVSILLFRMEIVKNIKRSEKYNYS